MTQYYVLFLYFLNLFLAVLGLLCYMGFSLFSESGGYFLVAVHRLLIVVASCCRAQAPGYVGLVVAARGLISCSSQALEHRLSSCGAQIYLQVGSSWTRD